MQLVLRTLYGFSLALLLTGTALAQQGEIAGEVTDSQTRELLSGVNVVLPELDRGVATDAEGRYLLEDVPAGEYDLVASFIGYQRNVRTVEVTAGETTVVNFALTPEAIDLEEVVVSVSTRDERQEAIGTDVEQISAEEVEFAPVSSISELLQGRSPGVSISRSSGEAGTGSKIRIRGATSITQDNIPLVYVDGIRVSNNTGTGPGSVDFANGQTISRVDDFDPRDARSVQVLKGPSATALWGAEAASGVILVETKEGPSGEGPVINFTTEQGLTRDITDYPANFLNLTTQSGGEINDPDNPDIQQFNPIQNPVTGDVFARHSPLENDRTEPFRTGRLTKYRMSLQDGGEDITYHTSVRYEDKEGVLRTSNFERFSGRANMSAEVSSKIGLKVNTNFVSSNFRLPDNDRSALGFITNGAAGLPQLGFGTRPDGSRGDCLGTVLFEFPESACEQEGNLTANFDALEDIKNEQESDRFTGNVVVDISPTTWFTSQLNAGIDYTRTNNSNVIPRDPERPLGSESEGIVQSANQKNSTVTFDYRGTVNLELRDNLSINTTAGVQYFAAKTDLVSCSGNEFASNSAIACDATRTFSGGSNTREIVEAGTFIRPQFNYNDYLYLNAAIRVDDNSAFGDDVGVVISPSVNTSFVVSDTPLWNVGFVESLRLRFAWGQASQAPAPFAADQTLRPVRVSQGLGEEGGDRLGVTPFAPGNPDLSPERNSEIEFGFDSELIEGRLSFSLTYYSQKNTDAIISTDVSPGTGFSEDRFVNIGEIENNGFEGTIDAAVLDYEEVTWDLGFQFSTQDPVITDLGDEPAIQFGLGQDFQMFREGFAPGAFYGPVIKEAERDDDGNIIPGSVELADGNLGDGTNNRHLGSPNPSNFQGISTTLQISNFRLSLLFERVGGVEKANLTKDFRSPFLPNISVSREFALREAELSPETQAALEKAPVFGNDFMIEDGSFVRWREASLTYSVPRSLYSGLVSQIDRFDITITGINLFTLTDYSGFDPESNFDGGSDSFSAGEFYTLAPSQSFTFRLDLSF